MTLKIFNNINEVFINGNFYDIEEGLIETS